MENLIKLMIRVLFTTKTKTKLSAEYSDPSNPKLFMTHATEKINELAEGLKQKNARIVALQASIAHITEEKDTIKKELESFKARHRLDVIEALTEGAYFKDEESRQSAIKMWDKSGLGIEEINSMLILQKSEPEEDPEKRYKKKGVEIQRNESFIK